MKPLQLKTHHFHSKLFYQKPMLRQIEWRPQNGPITRSGVLPVTTLFFWKICFSLEFFIFIYNSIIHHVRVFLSINEIYAQTLSCWFKGHSCMASTEGGRIVFRDGGFFWSCVCPHVQKVNLFFSTYLKFSNIYFWLQLLHWFYLGTSFVVIL